MESHLYQTAVAAFAVGQIGSAREMCEELLRQNKKDPLALDLLGQITFALGDYDAAVTHLTKCATIVPKSPRPHLLLAEVLTYQGRYREAVTRYDKVLKLSSGDPAAVAGKADVYEKQGRRDRARHILDGHRGDESPEIGVVRCRLHLHDGEHDAVIETATRHLDTGVEGAAQAHLHFLRGKALERGDRYDEAFDDYQAGNDALAVPYSDEALIRHVDELISFFTAERCRTLPRATHGSRLPILIVGMPRCGSTLFESILEAHPDVRTAGEIPTIQLIVNHLGLANESKNSYPSCVGDLTADDVETAARTYLEELRRHVGTSERAVDKFLNNHRHLGLVQTLLPEATIIHCRRDPVDTCLSCFGEPLPVTAHPFTTDLAALGTAYVAYARLMDHWRSILGDQLVEMDYESLVAQPEEETRRLLDTIGLPFDERCLSFWESGRVARTASYDQVNRPIYSTAVGRAERFGARLDPLRRALGGDV